MPLDVVTDRVAEDLLHRGPMMGLELRAVCHFSLLDLRDTPWTRTVASVGRIRIGLVAAGQRCIEIPTTFTYRTATTSCRSSHAVGIVDPPFEGDQFLRVVELRPGFLE